MTMGGGVNLRNSVRETEACVRFLGYDMAIHSRRQRNGENIRHKWRQTREHVRGRGNGGSEEGGRVDREVRMT